MSQVADRPVRPVGWAAPAPVATPGRRRAGAQARPAAEADPAAPRWQRTFAALRHRDFAVLMSARSRTCSAHADGHGRTFGYLA